MNVEVNKQEDKGATYGSKYYAYINSFQIVNPRRRVGIWRKVYLGNGMVKKCFVSIAGDSVMEPECFSVAKKELAILSEYNISQRGLNSSIDNALILEPYVNFKGANMLDLSYWCIPNSVKHQYLVNYNIKYLNNWQVESLCDIMGFLVSENKLNTSRRVSLNKNSSLFVGSYLHYITICEMIYLYQLVFSGKNTIIIFTNKQKCIDYYGRCVKLFGENSLNLRIKLFTQNNRDVGNWFPSIDITICTLDNANKILNRLMYENMFFNSIGSVLVDDIVIDKNSYKAFLLDGIIAKLNIMKHVNPHITCLYTLESGLNSSFDTNLINKVLRTEYISVDKSLEETKKVESHIYVKKNSLLYCWNNFTLERNKSENIEFNDNKYDVIELSEYVGYNNNDEKLLKISDLRYFFDLILDTISLGKKVLVFCPTIDWCKKSINSIVCTINELIKNPNNDSKKTHVLKERIMNYYNDVDKKRNRVKIARKLFNYDINRDTTDFNELIGYIINYGMAYHNCKLDFRDKRIIEESFSVGNILVLFSTSLKKINSDIKADRIIIRSIGMGKINHTIRSNEGNREWISRDDLLHFCTHINTSSMIRNEIVDIYNCNAKNGLFIFVNNELEFEYISNILNGSYTDVNKHKHVHNENNEIKNLSLSRFILEIIQINIIENYIELVRLFNELNFLKYNADGNIRDILLFSLSYLFVTQLITITPYYQEKDIHELILSKQYIKTNETFNCFDSPILISKFALMGGSSKKSKLIGSISNFINKKNNDLIKIETGMRYLEHFVDHNFFNLKNVTLITTSLGNSLIYSQLGLTLSLEVYCELIKAMFTGINMSNDFQIYYLTLTAFNSGEFPKVNWNYYAKLFNELNSVELEITDLYGVNIEIVKQISNTINNHSNNKIPEIGKFLSFSIHSSYFFSNKLSYKDLIEKYRFLNVYRFYYTCLIRDICDPNLTIEYIEQKYLIDLNSLKRYVNSFNTSAINISNLCKQLGWLELGDIFLNIVNHVESRISLKNVKYIQRILKNQSIFNNIYYDQEIDDQYHLSKLTTFINDVKELSISEVTPNVSILLYFSGLDTIEKISNSNVQEIVNSLNNFKKLNDIMLIPNNKYKSNNSLSVLKPFELYNLAKNIINNAQNLIVSKTQSSQINEEICSEFDFDIEKELNNELYPEYISSENMNPNKHSNNLNSTRQPSAHDLDETELELELELELESTQNFYLDIIR